MCSICDIEVQNDPAKEPESDDGLITCWCGARGKYEEMFAPMPSRCGGSGYMECDCGGDLCVCHNHGEMECFGCPDCEGDDDFDDAWG